MVRLTKIYTRGGDKGTTGLAGGGRVAKSALRLEAFGTVDELNCHLGVLRTLARGAVDEVATESEAALRQIQNDLFDIGSLMATAPGGKLDGMRDFSPEHVTFLEQRIDHYQQSLEPLASFVLPGGGELNACAHVGRAICRRAERLAWRLHEEEPVEAVVLQYINRLSDYLFVYARWVARIAGEEEFLWDTELSRRD